MRITTCPTVFSLEGGATLLVAGGTRWIVHGRLVPRQAWDAEEELIRIREHAAALLQSINEARSIYGGEPIK